MADLLTITEVSRRSGVASSALRFYETRGLIRSERAGSGHRRYERVALRRIAFIVFAQKMGLSLDEVAVELAKLLLVKLKGSLARPQLGIGDVLLLILQKLSHLFGLLYASL